MFLVSSNPIIDLLNAVIKGNKSFNFCQKEKFGQEKIEKKTVILNFVSTLRHHRYQLPLLFQCCSLKILAILNWFLVIEFLKAKVNIIKYLLTFKPKKMKNIEYTIIALQFLWIVGQPLSFIPSIIKWYFVIVDYVPRRSFLFVQVKEVLNISFLIIFIRFSWLNIITIFIFIFFKFFISKEI